MQYTAIIVAAGSSRRFKQDKLTFKINGEYLINHTISNFSDDHDCTKIVLVINENKYQFYKNLFHLNHKILVVKVNTISRSESVQKGLEYCNKSEFVLVHDGCRPYVTIDLIEKVKQGLIDGYDVVCPIIDITDSVIKVDGNIEYLNRDNIKRVQTPQGFRTTVLLDAFNKTNSSQTFNDEFSLVLNYNDKIKHLLVLGEISNTKITVPEDVNIVNYDSNDN